jgi:hypothetical protein
MSFAQASHIAMVLFLEATWNSAKSDQNTIMRQVFHMAVRRGNKYLVEALLHHEFNLNLSRPENHVKFSSYLTLDGVKENVTGNVLHLLAQPYIYLMNREFDEALQNNVKTIIQLVIGGSGSRR